MKEDQELQINVVDDEIILGYEPTSYMDIDFDSVCKYYETKMHNLYPNLNQKLRFKTDGKLVQIYIIKK